MTAPRAAFPTESAYRSALADRIREWLFEYLGGECDICGERCNLEIDHPWGRDWQPRRYSKYRRNLRYRREALAGEVRLLCREHNAAYRPVPRPAPAANPAPF